MSDYKQTDKYTWMLQQFSADFEYIAIRVKSLKEDEEENMCFPAFKIGTMYKGMELDKKYSLEELGL